MSEKIVLASSGWDHADWTGVFYPDDLPAEWRLTYYGNEFSAALVPADRWMQADGAACQGWSDDVSESFRFYLELPETGFSGPLLRQRLESCVDILSSSLAGVVCACVIEDEMREQLGGTLKGVPLALPLCGHVSLEGLPGEGIQLYRVEGSGAVWGAVETGEALSLPRLRALAEYLDSANRDTEGALFLTGDPADISRLQEARVLLELLGQA
jgi:hypothetical protein